MARGPGQNRTRPRRLLDDPPLVFLAERPPVTFACRWDNRPRQRLASHMTKAMTKGVTKPMTKPSPPIEQLALARLRLGFELLAPVLECLLWKPMNLAILALVQVATLPSLMMRPPERPRLDASTVVRSPSRSLPILQIEGENRSWPRGSRQVCEKWTLTGTADAPCFQESSPCFLSVICFWRNHLSP